MKFLPGEKIRRKNGKSLGCTANSEGVGTVVETPKTAYSPEGKVFFVDELNGGHVWISEDDVELVPEYEVGWKLNNGLVEIPRTAKVLKDETGDVVAYRLVKEPVVKEYTRYYTKEGHCYINRNTLTTTAVIFTEIYGVLDSVRLEKTLISL